MTTELGLPSAVSRMPLCPAVLAGAEMNTFRDTDGSGTPLATAYSPGAAVEKEVLACRVTALQSRDKPLIVAELSNRTEIIEARKSVAGWLAVKRQEFYRAKTAPQAQELRTQALSVAGSMMHAEFGSNVRCERQVAYNYLLVAQWACTASRPRYTFRNAGQRRASDEKRSFMCTRTKSP